MFRWYVLRAKTKQERFAEDNLRAQGFDIFLPMYRQQHLHRGLVVTREAPLYPPYLFARLDLTDEEQRWRRVYGTRGVSKVMSSAEDTPSPLHLGFVEELSGLTSKEGYLTFAEALKTTVKYAPGDLVQIDKGNFQGFTGTCRESSAKRVSVFLALLSRTVVLSLPITDVSPAKNGGTS